MLKEGVSDHCHERMSVKALPGSALEVVEAEFFFHLLVGLFANPSCLDDGSQSAQVRLGGGGGGVGFFFSCRGGFARGPGLCPPPELRDLVPQPLPSTLRRTYAHGQQQNEL